MEATGQGLERGPFISLQAGNPGRRLEGGAVGERRTPLPTAASRLRPSRAASRSVPAEGFSPVRTATRGGEPRPAHSPQGDEQPLCDRVLGCACEGPHPVPGAGNTTERRGAHPGAGRARRRGAVGHASGPGPGRAHGWGPHTDAEPPLHTGPGRGRGPQGRPGEHPACHLPLLPPLLLAVTPPVTTAPGTQPQPQDPGQSGQPGITGWLRADSSCCWPGRLLWDPRGVGRVP